MRARWLRRGAPAAAWMLGLCGAAPAMAQELYALAGAQYTPGLEETSYSFMYEYLHNLNDHLFATFNWLNEGHVTNHHRDGLSGQIWARWLSPSRRLALSAGAGPYRYYDTTYLESTGAVTDAHNWGVMYSAAAHWYFRAPWVLQLRYNYVHTTTSISTDTLLIGIGYQFESASHPGPVRAGSYGFAGAERNEVTLMAGNSIVNNFQSPHGVAYGLEYRRRVTPFIDATVTLLDEGDTHVVKRKGVAGEGWLTREFLDHRAAVGLGGGFYLARDEEAADTATRVLGLITMALSYRFSARWSTRLYWYRTITTDGRDSDVVLLGLGYAF